ncbi:MAG: FAD-dependent monooxygenase [Betaproteobacteria bacterium]|nr:FAD-dependent monooxygenase [Betaproteobacteria bacterium]
MAEQADVVIIGGGPVGAATALALAKGAGGGRRAAVRVLEERSPRAGQADPRALALSYGSRLMLERLGIWARLSAATPITEIHVSQKGSLGRARMRAVEEGLPALGYVVDYADLDGALHEALRAEGVPVAWGSRVTGFRATGTEVSLDTVSATDSGSLTARLVAIADGGRGCVPPEAAPARIRDYGQAAVVATVRTQRPHAQVAYERFAASGPVALLPWQDRVSLVWTASPTRAQALMAMAAPAFLDALQDHFGDRLGRFLEVGPRASFPLSLKTVRPVTGVRTVALGNAAQTLHPVAGQGFNLGLRDAWDLAGEILASPPDALGTAPMLARYAARRRLDTAGGIFFTDALVRFFSSDPGAIGHGRGLLLSVLDGLPPVKHFVARRMMFGARGF